MTNATDLPLVQKLLSSPLSVPPNPPSVETEWSHRSSELMDLSINDLAAPLAALDLHLTLRSHIAGHGLTNADLITWGTLRSNRFAQAIIKQGQRVNVSRWYSHIESIPGIADLAVQSATPKKPSEPQTTNSKVEFDFSLEDAKDGVVTRFPPEPSGFLHIGHAKAALLNNYFAHEKYRGTLLLRFDDTNPSKEKQEFEDAIVHDLHVMDIVPDKISHTSDHFQALHDYCVQLIETGQAYADDTDRAGLYTERRELTPSQRRDESIQDNLQRFAEMKTGSVEGQRWSIRAKISYNDPNGTLRDPIIYRCNPESHHRTGSTWKIYPMYDLACPVVDAIEGVTHALRTTEYNDRDAQYQWILKALGLRHVRNWNFARLNLRRTPLSKRRLTQFVDNGLVSGWNDPRMPTIQGLKRRGLRLEALHEFTLSQGPSRNIVNQDWSLIWAINKAHIDPNAGRYTAILKKDAVTCTILGVTECHSEDKPLHARHDIGLKRVVFGPQVIIEQADAALLRDGDEITLMNWGNVIVRGVHSVDGVVRSVEFELNLQGDFKKTKKVHWLCTRQQLVDVELVDFDLLITKDKLEKDDVLADHTTSPSEFREDVLADCNIAAVQEDAVLQFDRKAYYRVDRTYTAGQPAVMFRVPTGRT